MKYGLKYTQILIVTLVFSAGLLIFSPLTARADSCWNHNGSIMRLQAHGNQRWLSYEVPKPSLRNSGVRRGTLLFNGRKIGNTYEGTARRFSKYCVGTPLEYFVSGPVARNQLRVTVYGERQVYRRCQGTGQYRQDKLVFTYSHKC